MNYSRPLMAAGVALGSALAYSIYRRYRAAHVVSEEPEDPFYELNGVRVTAGSAQPLSYIDVDGIKLTRIGKNRL